jgi:transposase InsO family protein
MRDHQTEFEVKIMCRVLDVSRGGYYAWLRRQEQGQGQPPGKREAANRQLSDHIWTVFRRSRGTYGSPRIHADLREQGIACSRKRVARLMSRHGIAAKRRRLYKVTTTNSKHSYPVAPNVLNRRFSADRPNEKWLTDITYIPTREGWLYLAAVLDVYSRKVVGWAMDKTMEQGLVASALRMAAAQRRPGEGLLHHSDRGSQYAAHDYQRLLSSHNMICSMSGVGDCYDNAMMESFFSTLKSECSTGIYSSRAEAHRDIFEYIEVWYNRQRRHSALGYQSPHAFEQASIKLFSVSTNVG